MNLTDLMEMIRNGENSKVQFKRDDVHPRKLAAEIAALLNLEGGHIILGVEDHGRLSGLTRDPARAEEWVMQIARDHLQPSTFLAWESLKLQNGVQVGVISLPSNAPDKPYKARQGAAWVTKVRVGSTTRNASREEEQRLYQQSGGLHYGLKPVVGSTSHDLDARRMRDYFTRLLRYRDLPDEDSDDWHRLLHNLKLLTAPEPGSPATVDGVLLFGVNTGRFLPQSGIRAICYPGDEPDYATRADEQIRAPLTSLCRTDGTLIEPGLVEMGWDFVRRNTSPSARLSDAVREDGWEYPREAVREILVNALVHRDYSITGTDISISIFSNRLEVRSPGRLPNTITVDSLISGTRYARNQTLVNVMRDYRYVDARGMGIRNKVIPSMMAHNGTSPDLTEREHDFTVTLRNSS